MAGKNVENNYDASDIQVLEGLSPVRKRPGMYIGNTSKEGLHQLVYEVIDNSIDEAMGGYGDSIDVIIHKDNTITVVDHGRGIPVDVQKQTGKPALEVVLTVLHAGGKFGGGGYKVSGGLHGVGVSCVNALSESMIVTVHRDGGEYVIELSRGEVVKPMKKVKSVNKSDTGTTVWFKPDPEIFDTLVYDFTTLRHRLRELAFLNKNVVITLTDEREVDEETSEVKKETYHYSGGILSFVEEVGKRRDNLVNDEVIYFEHTDDKRDLVTETGTIKATDIVEVALQYNDSYAERLYSFVNNIETKDGGTHVKGFYQGFLQVINKFAHEMKFLKEDENLAQDDVKEGLVTVVSIKFQEPQFEGQTKTKLGSVEARALVKDAVVEYLTRYFEQHPDECKKIVEKNCLAQKAREAARKARELARSKSDAKKISLPGKLADCSSKKAEECEIYIVEGDSAGGSAKQGRDRRTQAILPLRGKILNVEKASAEKIFANEELRAMIAAFRCGTQDDYNESKLRYDKIIIMTDADVDGAHIRTLLLTFFYRFMKPLIENGHVYIAIPPLYKVTKGKQTWYTYNDEEQAKKIEELGGMSEAIKIQRYKGLGEMNPDQLYETTMDPEERTIIRCSIKDAEEADETFSLLMGDQVPPRRKFIEDNAHKVYNLDF